MFTSFWIPRRLARQHKGRTRPSRSAKVRRRGVRLALEQLEDRTVPSSFTAATVTDLINAINYANAHPGSYTIALTAPATSPYVSTAVNNSTDGATGLPVIAAGDNLTILGNGDTIARSTASGIPGFRLFDVASGASLTLANMTLQGGLASGGGVGSEGGAILNQGTLDLKGVTVENNSGASGGGIYSSGSLTLEAGTVISGNQAVGLPGGVYQIGPYQWISWPGGPAYGGGLYVAGGTATLTNVTLSSNTAQGGQGGTVSTDGVLVSIRAGSAFGGGLYVAGGTVTLASDTLKSNSAVGGNGDEAAGSAFGGGLCAAGGTVTLQYDTVTGNAAQGGTGSKHKFNGVAEGGGLYIGTVTTAYIDTFTVKNTTLNNPDDIYGSYVLTT